MYTNFVFSGLYRILLKNDLVHSGYFLQNEICKLFLGQKCSLNTISVTIYVRVYSVKTLAEVAMEPRMMAAISNKKCLFYQMHMILRFMINGLIFSDMVRELFVGLQSKAKSNMADIIQK